MYSLSRRFAIHGHPAGTGLHEGDPELREPNGHARLQQRDQVRDHRERVREGMDRHRRSELLELEREDREDRLHAVDRDGQTRLLRRVVDRIVELAAVEGLQPGRGQVGADVPGVAGVLADLRRSRRRVLRGDHDRASERRLVTKPALRQPVVVRACKSDGEPWVTHHREREQVIGEQNRLVDLELIELVAHHCRRAHDLGPVRAAGPWDPELRPR